MTGASPGSIGRVADAIDHVTKRRVAIKKIEGVFGIFENAKRTYREIRLLRMLNHANIINIVHMQRPKNPDTFTDVYIVFERMDLDMRLLGRDVEQELTLPHVLWFMYNVRAWFELSSFDGRARDTLHCFSRCSIHCSCSRH